MGRQRESGSHDRVNYGGQFASTPRAPLGFRDRDRLARPRTTAGHDETHIARGGAHQGSKAIRSSRQIKDDQVGPFSDSDAAGGVRVCETTASKSHVEDVPGGRAAVHTGDAICELDLSQHGRDVDHRVVRPKEKLDSRSNHAWDVRRHAEERIRSRAHHDRDGGIGAPFQVGVRRVEHVDEEGRGQVEDLVDVLSDSFRTVNGKDLPLPTDVRGDLLEFVVGPVHVRTDCDAIRTAQDCGDLARVVLEAHWSPERNALKGQGRARRVQEFESFQAALPEIGEARRPSPKHGRHRAAHRRDDGIVLRLRQDPMFEPVRRSYQLLEGPGELLRDDGVAEVRVRVPKARDDQSGREWIARPATADFDDDAILPPHGAFPEPPSIVQPARDAFHIRAKGGIALNIGGLPGSSRNLYGVGAFPRGRAAVAQPGRAAVSYVQAKTPAPKELQVGGSKPSGGSSSQTCRCSCKRQIRKLQVRGSNPCGGFDLVPDDGYGFDPGERSGLSMSAPGAARTHRSAREGCTGSGTAYTLRDSGSDGRRKSGWQPRTSMAPGASGAPPGGSKIGRASVGKE